MRQVCFEQALLEQMGSKPAAVPSNDWRSFLAEAQGRRRTLIASMRAGDEQRHAAQVQARSSRRRFLNALQTLIALFNPADLSYLSESSYGLAFAFGSDARASALLQALRDDVAASLQAPRRERRRATAEGRGRRPFAQLELSALAARFVIAGVPQADVVDHLVSLECRPTSSQHTKARMRRLWAQRLETAVRRSRKKSAPR